MENKILVLMILGIFLVSLASVSAGLGSFKQNSCVDIRVLANCSSVNLTEVRGVVINAPMSLLGGQTFNYSYCATDVIGTYAYSWNNPCVDCSQDDCGNSFEITPSGFANTLGFFIVIIIILGFLIALGFLIKDGWFVVFAGLGLMGFGIYSLINGIAGMKDTLVTLGTSLTMIGVGAYLAINSVIQMIDENS